jgi:transcriptional regulator with XRE-family HTH domain
LRAALKFHLYRAGLTQRQLARRVGMHENRLSSIIQGWMDPRPEERQAIAAALGRGERGLFRNIEPAQQLEQHDAVA